MHDIKFIRENPEAFTKAMQRRKAGVSAEDILKIDEQKRQLQTDLQHLQQERNAKSKLIGAAKAKGEDAQAIMDEVAAIKEKMAAIEAKLEHDELPDILARLPNMLDADVPDGDDEAQNKELRKWNEPKRFDFTPKEHFDLGEALGLMDFEAAAKMSGSRFVLLSGALARLERALGMFMLDLHTAEYGYTEVNPPVVVNGSALFGTGQLPKFEEDVYSLHSPADKELYDRVYKILNDTENYVENQAELKNIFSEAIDAVTKKYLIPTAEVSLTNIVANGIIDEETLPRRYVAFTPCFRSEAGSAGRDTRGMIRQHQFSKVELVSITHPEASAAEHERMTAAAEEVLKRLGLPYRVMLLCAGDTGFCAQKTYDIEVWLPGQNQYREISSCSNVGAFQARRMKARFRPEGQDKGAEFVHTLNGSGVAVGRALIAVMENYQQADGSIVVPEVLRPYMGGLEIIA